LKIISLFPPAAAVALLTAVVALTTVAQAPQAAPALQPQSGGPPHPPRNWPAPTNLKVLPKNLTGQQVRDIMEQWEGYLGVHCSTCHTPDKTKGGPNGRPQLNFADDSKEEKQTARIMFAMTEDINRNYVAKVPNSDEPVTCGTCHRGHLGPEPFEIPKEDHDRPQQPEGQAPAATPPTPPQ
jgi:hypothetical protein